MKARTVVGRGEKSLRSDPGSELPLGREKEKANVRRYRWDEQNKKKTVPGTRYLIGRVAPLPYDSHPIYRTTGLPPSVRIHTAVDDGLCTYRRIWYV